MQIGAKIAVTDVQLNLDSSKEPVTNLCMTGKTFANTFSLWS